MINVLFDVVYSALGAGAPCFVTRILENFLPELDHHRQSKHFDHFTATLQSFLQVLNCSDHSPGVLVYRILKLDGLTHRVIQ